MSRYLLLTGALLSGCVVGPRYQEPAANAPSSFASKSAGSVSASVEADWWKRLNDSQLNGFIAEAEAQNLDLKVAEARLKVQAG